MEHDATQLEGRARELVELADELAAEAQELGRQWEELAELVGAALADDRAASGEPDPIRLVALEMKLSGHDRDTVLAHLRRAFGDTADEPVLDRAVDEVFTGRFGPTAPD